MVNGGGMPAREWGSGDVDLSDIRPHDGSRIPVVQVKFVDAGGGFFVTWRWEHSLDRPRVWGLPREPVDEALGLLRLALPSPQEGEGMEEALRRSWDVLGHRDRELALSSRLAGVLVPYPLAVELNDLVLRGIRPHVRIQPSPSLAAVPWEALRVDEGERFVHNADVSVLPPASVRNAASRPRPDAREGGVVAVIDPRVPGGLPGLGSVLGDDDGARVRAMLAARGSLRPDDPADALRSGITRDALRDLLEEADRLLYVGHVTTGSFGLETSLHLADGADAAGRAAVIGGAHRPLTAADIAFGHDGHGPWAVPGRVALIACESGGESRFAEPTGLVATFVARGAEVVTAARWMLPTDAGLAIAAGAPVGAFAEAVVAIDAAHDADDPVAALNAWQRAQADRWEGTGEPAASPLIWAAFGTSFAPVPGAKS